MAKKVAVIMGSDSDWGTVKGAVKMLKSFDVETEVHVMSAHRTPAEASAFASGAREAGFGAVSYTHLWENICTIRELCKSKSCVSKPSAV